MEQNNENTPIIDTTNLENCMRERQKINYMVLIIL